MFEELAYQFKMRKLQRDRRKIEDGFRKQWQALVKNKGGRDERERLRFEEEINLREADEDINTLMTQYLREQARLNSVPLPNKDEDPEAWFQSDMFGAWFLSPRGIQKVRAEIRAERKADWEYWQARGTFALALIGSIFGVLAYFRK